MEQTAVVQNLLMLFGFIGTLFMNALKMIIVPIIISSILTGMLSMGRTEGLAKLGIKTVAFYIGTTVLAILTGLFFVNIIKPGIVSPEAAAAMVGQQADAGDFLGKVSSYGGVDLMAFVLRIIPANILEAASQNNKLLGLIFSSILIGFFLNKLPENLRTVQIEFWKGIHQMMISVTHFVIRFTPVGVFALITPIFVRTGFEFFKPLILFSICVLLGLATHTIVSMGLVLKAAGINPMKHFRAMLPAVITAFSTASSAASLPIAMECLVDKAKVSNRVTSFTMPLGTTINLVGTALYETVVVIFIAQFYSITSGFVIDITMQVTVAIMVLLTSMGMAGIPSASLVAITVILGAIGLPVEAIGIVLVVDRLLDMCRTAVNIFGDTVGAVVIGKSEGEKQIYKD